MPRRGKRMDARRKHLHNIRNRSSSESGSEDSTTASISNIPLEYPSSSRASTPEYPFIEPQGLQQLQNNIQPSPNNHQNIESNKDDLVIGLQSTSLWGRNMSPSRIQSHEPSKHVPIQTSTKPVGRRYNSNQRDSSSSDTSDDTMTVRYNRSTGLAPQTHVSSTTMSKKMKHSSAHEDHTTTEYVPPQNISDTETARQRCANLPQPPAVNGDTLASGSSKKHSGGRPRKDASSPTVPMQSQPRRGRSSTSAAKSTVASAPSSPPRSEDTSPGHEEIPVQELNNEYCTPEKRPRHNPKQVPVRDTRVMAGAVLMMVGLLAASSGNNSASSIQQPSRVSRQLFPTVQTETQDLTGIDETFRGGITSTPTDAIHLLRPPDVLGIAATDILQEGHLDNVANDDSETTYPSRNNELITVVPANVFTLPNIQNTEEGLQMNLPASVISESTQESVRNKATRRKGAYPNRARVDVGATSGQSQTPDQEQDRIDPVAATQSCTLPDILHVQSAPQGSVQIGSIAAKNVPNAESGKRKVKKKNIPDPVIEAPNLLARLQPLAIYEGDHIIHDPTEFILQNLPLECWDASVRDIYRKEGIDVTGVFIDYYAEEPEEPEEPPVAKKTPGVLCINDYPEDAVVEPVYEEEDNQFKEFNPTTQSVSFETDVPETDRGETSSGVDVEHRREWSRINVQRLYEELQLALLSDEYAKREDVQALARLLSEGDYEFIRCIARIVKLDALQKAQRTASADPEFDPDQHTVLQGAPTTIFDDSELLTSEEIKILHRIHLHGLREDDINVLQVLQSYTEADVNAPRDGDARDGHPAFHAAAVYPHHPFVPPPAANHANVEEHCIGLMSARCEACNALHFTSEPMSNEHTFQACCSHGQVMYEPISRGFRYHQVLKNLMKKDTPRSKLFMKNILSYNAMFSMCASRTTQRVPPEHINSRILFFGGQMQYVMNAARPGPNNRAVANQIFFLEPAERLRTCNAFEGVDSDIIDVLLHELARNPLMLQFQQMGRLLREDRRQAELEGRRLQYVALTVIDPQEVEMPAAEGQRYNAPRARYEVAVVYEGGIARPRSEIRVYNHEGGSHQIHHSTGLVDSLMYPLLHPEADLGWVSNTPHRQYGRRGAGRGRGGQMGTGRMFVTRREYASFRLSRRHNTYNAFLHGGKLTQTIICDFFMRMEEHVVQEVRNRQDQMYAATRPQLRAFMEELAAAQGVGVGRAVHLPRSFEGGPACMHGRYLDAMATVHKFGKPDLFITMTANPFWTDITRNLLPDKEWADDPFLLVQVFHDKLYDLVRSIERGEVYGPCLGLVFSIEFQKRGLPHAHIIVFLEEKITTPEQVDAIISAEIPDKVTEPRLHEIVGRVMLHNLCGERQHHYTCCQGRDNCAKGFPKPWAEFTSMDDGTGRVRYRRRDKTAFILKGIDNPKLYNSRYVVSYSPYLLKRYDCHINVDVVSSLRSLKYIFKYIFKGADALLIRTQIVEENARVRGQATAQMQGPRGDVAADINIPDMPAPPDNRDYAVRPDLAGGDEQEPHQPARLLDYDETVMYFNTRYVSCMECAWRIRSFPMHHATVPVQTLVVHEEGQGYVYHRRGEEQEAYQRPRKLSTLEAYMELNNGPHRELAMQYPYERCPEMFVVDPRTGAMKQRTVVAKMHRVIGRLAAVSVNTELYFIRLLLKSTVGYRTYIELRTIRGVRYNTHMEACVALGLLTDDAEHLNALTEACLSQYPRALRRLFVNQVLHCGVLDPIALFDVCQISLCSDFRRMGRNPVEARRLALRSIAGTFDRLGQRPPHWEELLAIEFDDAEPVDGEEVGEHHEIHAHGGVAQTDEELERLTRSLNAGQREFFDSMMDIVENRMLPDTTLPDGTNLFFLRGAGGTGKTYLYKALCCKLRSIGKKYKCVAWTGVASQLLPGGSTSHYTFGLPFDLIAETATSSLHMDSPRALLLRNAHVLIWDEISMAHRRALDVVCQLLQNIMGNNLPFGGKLLIVGGDFHQLLPVVTGANAAILQALASPCYGLLWPLFRMHTLTENRRALQDPEFAAYLITLAEGRTGHSLRPHTSRVQLPQQVLVGTPEELLDLVFGGDMLNNGPSRAILTPRNVDCLALNDQIVAERLFERCIELFSVDAILPGPEERDNLVPLDSIHDLVPSGLPQHRLRLKFGTIVVLLRNLDVTRGLCNGARMKVLGINTNVIRCQMITGDFAGEIVFFPRMRFEASGVDVPVAFTRLQFPVRIGYVVTINRAQGQTYERVGVLLPNPVFSHGHLYVALSRVASYTHLYICNQAVSDRTMTTNIVNVGILQTSGSLRGMVLPQQLRRLWIPPRQRRGVMRLPAPPVQPPPQRQ